MVGELRPQLFRYCARLTGSAVDGEDVVQDALVRALISLKTGAPVRNLRGWLFRIAHHQAIDHLRRRERLRAERIEDHPAATAQEPPLVAEEMATIAVSFFLQLTPLQRSCVFLKDVLDHSLSEIAELHEASVTAVKAALHRGRRRLRELARQHGAGAPVPLHDADAHLLARYVERFNARDFDTVRAMLAQDARLDLVGRKQMRGVDEVGGYFENYDKVHDWHMVTGNVEGRPAIVVYDSRDATLGPHYFVLIQWADDRITSIRDYRYSRHVITEAAVIVE